MFASGVPAGSKPVKVALVSEVAAPRVKSSAVSVWIWPAPAGCDNVAIRPSGGPLSNANDAAKAGVAVNRPRNAAPSITFAIRDGMGRVLLLSSQESATTGERIIYATAPFSGRIQGDQLNSHVDGFPPWL